MGFFQQNPNLIINANERSISNIGNRGTLINQYEGEPSIRIGENGANLPFINGQPIVDGGFENAVLISLFTSEQWPGNVLYPEKSSYSIGSDFENVASGPLTLSSLESIRKVALNALDWFLTENLAEEINIEVINPRGNRLEIIITLKPPGQDVLELSLTKNSLNWQFQASTPAHKR